MLSKFQQTVTGPIQFKGVGLHSGKKSTITILPAEANQGIIFKRIDLKQNNLVRANYQNVTSAKLCTTLQNSQFVKVSTVEHLLAALYIVGIDNAVIEIDNEEVPIMDGSAKNFLDVLNNKNHKKFTIKRKYLKIMDKVELIDGERKISIEPNDSSFAVEFQLNYKNKIIGKQKNQINFQKDDLKDVIESRTFCLFNDIEKIKKIGLAKGGSLENAIVVDEDKVLNKDGLRNGNEFVNHKILDLAGDFLLSEFTVLGKVKCYQGGHELTNLFLRKLFKQKSCFLVTNEVNNIFSKKITSFGALKIAANA